MTRSHKECIKSLYSPSEVKQVRQDILSNQSGLDALTGLPIPTGNDVLDHDHQSQMVRGVLHRQTNIALGRIENMFIRDLRWWYPGTLSDFLKDCSVYLSSEPLMYYHPGWIKRVQTDFNSLTAKQKELALDALGYCGNLPNDLKRKAKFKEILLTKLYDYPTIKSVIHEAKSYKNKEKH